MKIIVTIIPIELVANSHLSSFCPFLRTKSKNHVFRELVIQQREIFLFFAYSESRQNSCRIQQTFIKDFSYMLSFLFVLQFHGKTIFDEVIAFDPVLMNIFTNYILNKYMLFDDQGPPQLNDRVKLKIKKQKTFSLSKQKTKNLQFAITEFSEYITERKNQHNFQLSQSLNNPYENMDKDRQRYTGLF